MRGRKHPHGEVSLLQPGQRRLLTYFVSKKKEEL